MPDVPSSTDCVRPDTTVSLGVVPAREPVTRSSALEDHRRSREDVAPDAPPLSRVLHAGVGVVLTVLGVVSAVAAEATGARVTVVGLDTNGRLGLAVAGLGVLLLVAALSRDGRALGGGVGGLLVAGGVVLVAATDRLLGTLAAGRSLGWVLVVTGAVAILGSFLHRTNGPIAAGRAGAP